MKPSLLKAAALFSSVTLAAGYIVYQTRQAPTDPAPAAAPADSPDPLKKEGAGRVILPGSKSYSGGTLVTPGTLDVTSTPNTPTIDKPRTILPSTKDIVLPPTSPAPNPDQPPDTSPPRSILPGPKAAPDLIDIQPAEPPAPKPPRTVIRGTKSAKLEFMPAPEPAPPAEQPPPPQTNAPNQPPPKTRSANPPKS